MNAPSSASGTQNVIKHHTRMKPETNEFASDRVRRWIVFLIFIIYWLLIFEGALRKWLFPSAFQVIFFIRDPFVLLVYGLAILRRRSLPGGRFLAGWLVLGMFALLVGLVQLWTGDTGLIVFGYGWRNYFYYIPLAFIIGANFRKQDLERLVRQTLLLAIPIAVLAYFQYKSSPEALINAGAIEGGLYQPGVVRNIVRTYGTFTSSLGQTLFVASVVALLLYVWILPARQRPIRGALLLIASVAAITNLAVSGSRTAIIHSGLIVLSALFNALMLPPGTKRLRYLILPLIFVVFAIITSKVMFSGATTALQERSVEAFNYETQLHGPSGTLGRVLSDLGNFRFAIPLAPFWGYGVGWFGNAFSGQISIAISAEEDWSRNILELGPLLGLLFMCLRITFVAWLFKNAVATVRRTGECLPLLLVGFIGIVLLMWQITGQGTVNGYGWLFAGFCIAANQSGRGLVKSSTTRHYGCTSMH